MCLLIKILDKHPFTSSLSKPLLLLLITVWSWDASMHGRRGIVIKRDVLNITYLELR